jgi:hypothetical protein
MDDPTKNALKLFTTSPLNIFKEAMKKIPQLKWGLGILGIIALIVFVVSSFKISLRLAVFGTLIMIFLMILLVIFAALTKASGALKVAAVGLLFAVLLLGIATGACLFTSVFFKWPVNLQNWITGGDGPGPGPTPTPSPTPTVTPPDSASIVLREGRTVQSAIENIANLDNSRARITNCSRIFLQSKIRGGLARAETVEKLIEQLQYRINNPKTNERYTVTRKVQEQTYEIRCTKN